MNKILFVTDLYYEAKGRLYYEEDLFLTGELSKEFCLAICHPKDMNKLAEDFDLVIFRNTGVILNFKEEYREFRKLVAEKNIKTHNSFTGRGDMDGKNYLLELTKENLPVIRTINNLDEFDKLPKSDMYAIKPIDGADSIGLEFLSKEDLFKNKDKYDENTLIQPKIDFEYELSFYFLDNKFMHALYAPNPDKRWQLEIYTPTEEDLEFAQKFVDWNHMKHGIQRIDACRAKTGELLLVELEDLNPYLSLLDIPVELRDKFVDEFKKSIKKVLVK